MAAVASRTLSICQRRTPIAVRLGSNCHIALRARRTASGYGATGPQPVKLVRLDRSARLCFGLEYSMPKQDEGDKCAQAIIADAFESRLEIESIDMRAI